MSSPRAPASAAERIIARLTPPGRGALAVLAVQGAGAVSEVGGLFSPAGGQVLATLPPNRGVFGRFGPEPAEEVVILLRGPESLEIHCHGGALAIARIETLLAARGWRSISWSEWLARTQPDAIRREAAAALAEASTQRTAAVLLDQLQGALHRAISSVEAALAAGRLAMAQTGLEQLLQLAPVGLHLTTPWRVVLAGPPNAGKSSLFNALAGFPRAIVHPHAGTTRDVVTLATAIEGWPVLLCDTAGLRQAEDLLESAGVERTQDAIERADIILAVFDATRPWQEQEGLLPRLPSPVVVHNKLDLVGTPRHDRPLGNWTSAVTGEGLEDLIRVIATRLVPQPPEPGQAVPFTQSQVSTLRSALEAVAGEDAARARELLISLLEGSG